MSVTVIDAVARMRPDMGDTLLSFANVGKLALGVGLAVGAAGVALVKMGMDAQTQLSIVAGLTGATAQQMSYYTTALEGLGVQMGFTLDQSAKGLYYVVSAGYSGADAITVLKEAMMHAAAAGAPLKDVADGITSAMNAYGAKANQAAYYSDLFTTAVTYGKQTTEDFSAGISKAALMAASAHVPFIQLAAAEADLTEKGVSSATAFTSLSFLMSKIAVPSAQSIGDAVKALGGHLDDTKYSSADLMGKLLLLRDASGLTEDQFLKLIGGTRSAKAALGLLTDGGAAYDKILGQMANDSGVTADAFQVHTKTMGYAFDQVKAAVSNAGYELVKMISPAAIAFLETVAGWAGKLPALFHAIGDTIGPAFKLLGDSVTYVDTPVEGFIKHTGRVTDTLVTTKGVLSKVGDYLHNEFGAIWDNLGDHVTKVGVPIMGMNDHLGNVNTATVTTKGYLSRLRDYLVSTFGPAWDKVSTFITDTVIPAVKKFGDFVLTQVVPALGQLNTWFTTQILPTLLQFAGFILNNVVPALEGLWIWFTKNILPALESFATFIVKSVVPAIEGLWNWFKIKILPALEDFAAFVVKNVIPALEGLWTWFTKNILPALKSFAEYVTKTLLPAIEGMWTWFQTKVLPVLQKVATIIVTNVIPAVQNIATTVIKQLIPALQGLWNQVSPVLIPAFQLLGWTLQHVVVPAFQALISGISVVINFITWLSGVIGGLLGWLGGLRDKLNQLGGPLGGATNGLGAFLGMLQGIGGIIGGVIGQIHNLANAISNVPSLAGLGQLGNAGRHASGGVASGWSIVGEQGPELAFFGSPANIMPAPQTAAMLSGGGNGGGGYRTANIYVQLDGRTLAAQLAQPLVDVIRLGTGLRV